MVIGDLLFSIEVNLKKMKYNNSLSGINLRTSYNIIEKLTKQMINDLSHNEY